MSERRIVTRDFRGDDFKVVIRKSDSDESMEEGELSDDDARPGWGAPKRNIIRATRPDIIPDILREIRVEDRRVVEREEAPEKRKETVFNRLNMGGGDKEVRRKRNIAFREGSESQLKSNFHISKFKQNFANIVRDNQKSNNTVARKVSPVAKSETFIEKEAEGGFDWKSKLKRPRMGMVADMVEMEGRIPAKHRLHINSDRKDVIKRKVSNQQPPVERINILTVNKLVKKPERNVVMTEVVEEEEDEEEDGFFNIGRTVKIAEEVSLNSSSKRLEVDYDHRVIKSKVKKMEDRLGRRRNDDEDIMDIDNRDDDLPDWDGKVVIQVSHKNLESKQSSRRREVMEELDKIDEAKQREENRRKLEESVKKEELRKMEEVKRKEDQRIEKELRKREEMKIREEELKIEELRKQEELMTNKLRLMERQSEIEKEKQELEQIKKIKETENLIQDKKLENEARVREELMLIKDQEKQLKYEKRYRDRRSVEKTKEERRKEEKRKKYKYIEKKRKMRKRYSSDSSSDSDSDSSSSSESDSESSETESDDSEYEERRRKAKSKESIKKSDPKKKSSLEKERENVKARESKQIDQTKSNKQEKAATSSKPKHDERSESRSESRKESVKDEKKHTGEDSKKTVELKDKLKSYLNRAKEAKENKKK